MKRIVNKIFKVKYFVEELIKSPQRFNKLPINASTKGVFHVKVYFNLQNSCISK